MNTLTFEEFCEAYCKPSAETMMGETVDSLSELFNLDMKAEIEKLQRSEYQLYLARNKLGIE